jgi:chitinase
MGTRRVNRSKIFVLPLLFALFLFQGNVNGGEWDGGLPITIELTASAVSSHEVVLTWSDVGATGYTLYEKDSYVETVFGTSATRRLLNSGTLYCYRVVAFYASAGSTEQSNQSCVSTPADRTPPTVPANVDATPESSGRVHLSWSRSRDDGFVAGYTAYRDGAPIGDTAVTSFVDSGLLNDVLYCYSISAYDGSGNESEQSEFACVEPGL